MRLLAVAVALVLFGVAKCADEKDLLVRLEKSSASAKATLKTLRE